MKNFKSFIAALLCLVMLPVSSFAASTQADDSSGVLVAAIVCGFVYAVVIICCFSVVYSWVNAHICN